MLTRLADQSTQPSLRPKALWLRQRAVDIMRELSRRHPRQHQRWLAWCLHNLGDLLNNLGRREVAINSLREAVSLWRSLYTGGGKRSGLKLALQRYGKIVRTAARKSTSTQFRNLLGIVQHIPKNGQGPSKVCPSVVAVLEFTLGSG